MYILYVNISEYQEKKTVNMHLWNKLFKIGTIQNVKKVALTGVAQWVGCPPADHMATGSGHMSGLQVLSILIGGV